MPIISFAQNLEDVILHRALSSVQSGFFIDVGAGDPDDENVTRAFKDLGWRGINIEVVEEIYNRLKVARPDDVNICGGLDSHSGERDFYIVDSDTRLSTLSPAIAHKHRTDGLMVRVARAPFYTLAEICEQHVRFPIHFLKIDVVGAEKAVLEGANFDKFRPWIIVIEATRRLPIIDNAHEWEPILLESNYTFVYTDRLNRFYVANEKLSDLRQYFGLPPNIYDNYKLAQTEAAKKEAALVRGELQACQAALKASNVAHEEAIEVWLAQEEALRFERDACQQEMFESDRHAAFLLMERQKFLTLLDEERQRFSAAAEEEANSIRISFFNSTSWRLTKPLRIIKRLFKGHAR